MSIIPYKLYYKPNMLYNKFISIIILLAFVLHL